MAPEEQEWEPPGTYSEDLADPSEQEDAPDPEVTGSLADAEPVELCEVDPSEADEPPPGWGQDEGEWDEEGATETSEPDDQPPPED